MHVRTLALLLFVLPALAGCATPAPGETAGLATTTPAAPTPAKPTEGPSSGTGAPAATFEDASAPVAGASGGSNADGAASEGASPAADPSSGSGADGAASEGASPDASDPDAAPGDAGETTPTESATPTPPPTEPTPTAPAADAAPIIDITLTADKEHGNAADPITFTLTIINHGPGGITFEPVDLGNERCDSGIGFVFGRAGQSLVQCMESIPERLASGLNMEVVQLFDGNVGSEVAGSGNYHVEGTMSYTIDGRPGLTLVSGTMAVEWTGPADSGVPPGDAAAPMLVNGDLTVEFEVVTSAEGQRTVRATVTNPHEPTVIFEPLPGCDTGVVYLVRHSGGEEYTECVTTDVSTIGAHASVLLTTPFLAPGQPDEPGVWHLEMHIHHRVEGDSGPNRVQTHRSQVEIA